MTCHPCARFDLFKTFTFMNNVKPCWPSFTRSIESIESRKTNESFRFSLAFTGRWVLSECFFKWRRNSIRFISIGQPNRLEPFCVCVCSSSLLLVSTLDGTLSALDVDDNGRMLWALKSSTFLSSSISKVIDAGFFKWLPWFVFYRSSNFR